jgi:hypothetical protein
MLRPEVAVTLLGAWLASWAAEEHALHAAERDHMLSPAVVHQHLDTIRAEREQVRSLLR